MVFTVLVVDDEPNIRLGAERILRGTGFNVATADSGEQGLETLKERACDILLLDLMMPGMGGMEVLKEVSVAYPEMIVIVITGYATLETAVEAMKWGAYDFIPKPFQPDQLRIVVSRAAEKLRLKAEHKRLAEERLQNLREIEREKNRTRVIVQSMSEGVVLTDRDGKVVLCNPAARRLLSLDMTPIPSSSVESFITHTNLKELVLSVCSCPEKNGNRICSREVQLDDGMWLMAKVTPVISEEGDEAGAVTVLSDITTQKSLAQMKSEFVARVSHELRSPLAAMNQQLAVVLSDLDDSGEMDDCVHRITRVRERTQGLMDLISDLLDISQIELGVEERSLEAVDPFEMLARTTEMFAPKIQEKSLALELKVHVSDDRDKAPLSMMDPRELESIYVNLLSNAIKYTREGGAITIEGSVESSQLRIAFRDTGIGIEESELKRIFEKFYRVKSEETRMIVGTGLGLPIVKGIVDANNGKIDVQSSPGQGTTVTVRLPMRQPE